MTVQPAQWNPRGSASNASAWMARRTPVRMMISMDDQDEDMEEEEEKEEKLIGGGFLHAAAVC